MHTPSTLTGPAAAHRLPLPTLGPSTTWGASEHAAAASPTRCAACSTPITPDGQGSWVDSTDGDGCDSPAGVHQPQPQVECGPCGARTFTTPAGHVICSPCSQPTGRCLCD